MVAYVSSNSGKYAFANGSGGLFTRNVVKVDSHPSIFFKGAKCCYSCKAVRTLCRRDDIVTELRQNTVLREEWAFVTKKYAGNVTF